MDITKYVAAVAQIIQTELDAQGCPVAKAAQKSGVPRTTLQRKLEHPNQYPFTIAELAQLASVCDLSPSVIIQRAEALANEERESR